MASTQALTLSEAAFLASACLAHEAAASRSSGGPSHALLETALRFDPGEGPVSVRVMRLAIDEGIVKSWKKGSVVVDESAVIYVASLKLLTMAGELTLRAKKTLYKALRSRASAVSLAPHLVFDTGELIAACRSLLELYRKRVDDWIVEDSDIMGGLPCIRGTRIPVYTILGRIEEGESFDEIARDMDHVPHEALEAAIAFARTHPRRGRPRQFR